MRRLIFLGWLTGAALAAGAAMAEDELTLTRVVLSTGGVGYFEHEAVVSGDGTLLLDIRLDQVDDILKSLVVRDAGGGSATVSLPGRQPLDEIFRDLPFGHGDLRSPVDLFNALQGAEVRSSGARSLRGSLLSVVPETARLEDGGTITRHRVSIVTDAGVQQLVLEDIEALELADPVLRGQVAAALAAMAEHRAEGRRGIAIAVTGSGERRVQVGYVAAAPLWKTSYRLDLGSGVLQGWAVLENMSGQDWDGVDLTLMSGNPVTFRQALYETYYVDRPEVPVEVFGRVLPPVDPGAFDLLIAEDAPVEMERALRRAPEPAPALAAPPSAPPAPAVAVEEAATQVVFRYPQPVSVAAGYSLSLPIIDRAVPTMPVALYQPEVHSVHPLAAVRLVNDGDTGLPPGVLTLYDRAGDGALRHVGDARLAPLPAGETRLLSFALDHRTRIDADHRSARRIGQVAASGGVMRLVTLERESTRYRIAAPAGEDRLVVIEHPRRPDWELVEPTEAAVAVTEDRYRIERPVSAGGLDELTVTLERPVMEQIEIVDLPLPRLIALARATELDDRTRQAFMHLADLQRAVDVERRALADLDNERMLLHDEQARLRENLQAVPRDSDLYRRYLDSLAMQEDRLDAIAAERRRTESALSAAEAALAEAIATLEL